MQVVVHEGESLTETQVIIYCRKRSTKRKNLCTSWKIIYMAQGLQESAKTAC